MKKQILITIIGGSIVVSGAITYSVLSGKTEDKTVITEVIAESKDGSQKIVAVEEIKNNTITLKVSSDITEKALQEVKNLIKQGKIQDARRKIGRFNLLESSVRSKNIEMQFEL